MRLGIDASNLRAGGGVTHLVELLRAAESQADGLSEVIVWGGKRTLGQIEDRPWLIKSHRPALDRNLLCRVFWQRFRLPQEAAKAKCDILFAPGGSFARGFRPVVTMSRNMLPFDWREVHRYRWSPMLIRLLLLRWLQSRSFKAADGLIFLTEYARTEVLRVVKSRSGLNAIIPHGVDARFVSAPREQLPMSRYSAASPRYKILYVSTVHLYKHQWKVVEAVASLRQDGLPVELELVGKGYPPADSLLRDTIKRADPGSEFVKWIGDVPYAAMSRRYAQADLCLFASSCENMPNILLEGMASGLPIACSKRGPMPEVLGEAGIYFDPEDPHDIAGALRTLIASPELRAQLARASHERAKSYTWPRCARDTFRFLHEVVRCAAS